MLGVGAAATTALTVATRISYDHDQQRLTSLQTKLTASALSVAQDDIELRLGHALDLASEAAVPAHAFAAAIASAMAPKGPFVLAGLRLVTGGRVETLSHIGLPGLMSPSSAQSVELVRRAAATSKLVTTHVMGDGKQRLSYLLSAKVAGGVLVGSAAEVLPSNRRVSIPPGSPDSDLYVAIYFGPTTSSSALLETNAPRLPLTGTTASAHVAFGTSVLTLVAAPQLSLVGSLAQFAPWFLLIVGLLLTVAIGLLTDRLVIGRLHAEALAVELNERYREQRTNSETLQRALLPRQFPSIAGVELASLYLPGSAGLEVGGDWYSVVRVDEDRFAFVVGDVSGRGLGAARVMAELRFTARTLASLGFSPNEILTRTGQEIDLGREGHFATALLGTADRASGRLSIASAGHLRPLLLHDGLARYLEVPIGTPLGLGASSYEELSIPIPHGATLIGFTDGLVERRDTTLDEGLERLRLAATAEVPDLDSLLQHVVGAVWGSPIDDDVALLGVRWEE